MVNNKVALSDVFLFFIFISIFIIVSSDLALSIIVFVSFSIYIISIPRHGFSSPFGLFVLVYLFYSVSYPLHSLIRGRGDDPYTLISLQIHIIGMLGFFLSSIVFRVCENRKLKANFFYAIKNRMYFLWSILLVFALAFAYKVSISGATSKQELSDSAGGFLYYMVLMYILVSSYLVIKISFEKFIYNIIFVSINLFVLMIVYLYSGERDIVFKFLFFTMVFYFDCKFRFRKKYYVLFTIAIFTILPISQFYKASLLAEKNIMDLVVSPEEIFVGEFLSSGRNVSKIVEFSEVRPNDIIYGERMVFDILRFFRVKSIDGIDVESTGSWYNNVVLPSINIYPNSGWGFSWVGFLYISFGYVGPFIGMFILGSFLSYSYSIRFNNIHYYVFYALTLAIAIYIQRADLANLLGQVIKFTIFPIFLISIWLRLKVTK